MVRRRLGSLADTEEVGLGVIPEKFIRQIYLKSLPPQWNSFKLKQSGHDGKVVDHSSGTRVMRERNMEELMEAASEHKARRFTLWLRCGF